MQKIQKMGSLATPNAKLKRDSIQQKREKNCHVHIFGENVETTLKMYFINNGKNNVMWAFLLFLVEWCKPVGYEFFKSYFIYFMDANTRVNITRFHVIHINLKKGYWRKKYTWQMFYYAYFSSASENSSAGVHKWKNYKLYPTFE